MNKFKIFFIAIIFALNFQTNSISQNNPVSFADLAEKLMPSVVNISTTTIIKTQSNPFPFQFPPGSPFEDMFKEFGTPQERQSAALGSGFIIDDKGIVKIVKDALAKTIKTSFEDFQLDSLKIQNELTPQSEEIRSAVEDDEDLGAGDQGIMVGYATNETESFMPPTFDISRNIYHRWH